MAVQIIQQRHLQALTRRFSEVLAHTPSLARDPVVTAIQRDLKQHSFLCYQPLIKRHVITLQRAVIIAYSDVPIDYMTDLRLQSLFHAVNVILKRSANIEAA